MNSNIILIKGCMFSGKTTELLSRVREGVLFKPKKDDRYHNSKIVSHNGLEKEAKVVEDILDINEKNKVIGIDEINLFENNSQEIIKFIKNLAQKNNRIVISGLDQDFKRDPFPPVPKLTDISDKIINKNAVCSKCGGKATTTQRLINDKPVTEDSELLLIDGKNSYEPRCESCHVLRKE